MLDSLFSLCNVRLPEIVCITALQCISVISTNKQVCDAIVDSNNRNPVAKLLAMTTSVDERVCVFTDCSLCLIFALLTCFYPWKHGIVQIFSYLPYGFGVSEILQQLN
jgi:uncharacterized membrane protein (UPF0182 family)